MNPLDKAELSARVEAISQGPWRRKGRHALKEIAPSPAYLKLIPPTGALDLSAIPLSKHERELGATLRRTLRWHGTEGISSKIEIKLRDSFDDALTYAQLLELAVQSGYLPEDQLPVSEARPYLASLIWSEPARKYLKMYGYDSVEYLADRLNLKGIASQEPPTPNPRGEVLFSAFLATHKQIEDDKEADTWLGFLDDYIVVSGEQDDFYDFLEKGEEGPSKRFATLLSAAYITTISLGDFFRLCPGEVKGTYGFFYAYWLAKMHGYTSGPAGYVRDS